MSLEDASLNKTTYRITNKGYGKPAPLVVNGDDCLLRGKRNVLRPIWESHCKMAGLESSVGKTYFSQEFCTINSTIFAFKKEGWVESKYINLGLMMGKKRMGAGQQKQFNQQVPLHQLGVICRELKRTCPENLWPDVKKRFIYYNFQELSKTTLPWFIPGWLGGVGLPYDFPFEISESDRCCATYIKYTYADPKWSPVLPKDAAMWLMHKKVLKDLRPHGVKECHFRKILNGSELEDIEENFSKLYKLMTVNLLMKEDLESLYQILDEDRSARKAILHNEDVWRRARKNILSVGPMSDCDMLFESKKTYIPVVLTENMELRCHMGHYLPVVDESL